MVAGNSSVVFPKICTKLGLLSALVTTSAVTVESFPPENEITIFSGLYFCAASWIKAKASSLR